jgi:lipopolysaccharide/colanic/teichoic acid biosynthesis glycosyltransferase
MRLIRPKKIALQLLYVKRASLWTDMVIFLQTFAVVVLGIKPRVILAEER